MQEYLLTFEQTWTDEARGRTLPKFGTDELHRYLDCGILGRRMSEGAANLVDHVLPAVPIRQFVLTPGARRSPRRS